MDKKRKKRAVWPFFNIPRQPHHTLATSDMTNSTFYYPTLNTFAAKLLRLDIILVCYNFPPFPGIGGRRWAKFAKYLVRKGYRVHVISARPYPGDSPSPWTAEVDAEPNIIRHYLPPRYPQVLMRPPRHIFDKVMYKVWSKLLPLLVKGDYLDRAGRWGKPVRAKIKELAKAHNITNVLVTGKPFHLVRHVALIKKELPHLHVIGDVRDPWTTCNDDWSFGKLSPARQEQEREIEREAARNLDVLISVYPENIRVLKPQLPEGTTEFVHISNGFDREDYEKLPSAAPPPADNKIRFVYAGTLYSKLDHVLLPFFDSLERLKTERAELYQRLVFDFYGNIPQHYAAIARERGLDVVQFHGRISLDRVFRELKNADFCPLFIVRNYEFSYSTKYYECLSQGKKIVAFSAPGEMPEFVEANHIGYKVYPETFHSDFVRALEAYGTEDYHRAPSIDIEKYNVAQLTNSVEALLKQPS